MFRSTFRSAKVRPQRRADQGKSRLRAEWLEPRLLLDAGAAWQDSAWALEPGAGAAAAVAAQGTALAPNADASVRGGSFATTNYGNATTFSVADDTTDKGDYQSFLRFDLSSVVGNVTSAALNLTPVSLGSSASTLTMRVRLLTDAADGWVEGNGGKDNKPAGELTWNNRPIGSGLEVTIAGSQLKTGQALAVDVTTLVNQASNANKQVSLQIDATSAPNSRRTVSFASREHATAGYRPTLTVTTSNQAPTVVSGPTATPSPVTGTTTALAVLGDDDQGEAALKYTWSATTLPSGATAPGISPNGTNAAKNATATFSSSGDYVFAVTIADAAGLTTIGTLAVTVTQTLTSVAVSPASVSLLAGSTQQFAATARDQFGRSMASQPAFTWSATAGTIDAAGLYTAPAAPGTALVTASAGSLFGSAAVTVTNSLGLLDPELASTTSPLLADGLLDRNDMIQILARSGNDDGVVDATEINDLKTILGNGVTFPMPGYVKVLSSDVVNGNQANAYYQGQTLGNLAAGDPSAKMDKLVSKWFLGADHPATGYSYQRFSGSLFANTPTYTDTDQGALGDCYFIASMGSIAKSSVAAVQNMFIDNGDSTWTVRFYAGTTADYVTVDRYLPVSGSYPVYQGVGGSYTNAGNDLWLALAEKAYAQWNETGKEGRSPAVNSYASIEGGWMYNVCNQVLGNSCTTVWWMPDSEKQRLIDGINANKAVTYATNGAPGDGLYGPHAYVVVSYNSTADTFQLWNPWGSSHPGPLTYTQLRTNGQCFVIADTSATTPPTAAASVSAAAAGSTSLRTHSADLWFTALGTADDGEDLTAVKRTRSVIDPALV